MKLTALGVNSAFATGEVIELPDGRKAYIPKWQSNFLFEFDRAEGERPYRFVLDFGSDIRHSLLFSANYKMGDIDAWYCSHPHADHIGGVEGIALSTFFHPMWRPEKKDWIESINPPGNYKVVDALLRTNLLAEEAARNKDLDPDQIPEKGLPDDCKPEMFGHKDVLKELWQAASPGLNTLQGVRNVKLSTYFKEIKMIKDIPRTIQDGNRTWKIYTQESTHVVAGSESMPCYGLIFHCSDGKRLYFPTDTIFMVPPNMESIMDMMDEIFQDCETDVPSGVHAHFDTIRKGPPRLKKKMRLYHYNTPPQVEEGEFLSVLRTGDVLQY